MSDSQFNFWAAALRDGKPVDTEPGNPRSGFYRLRDRNQDRSIRFDAVAIWRDDAGELCCARTGRAAPTHPDEIDTLFSYCAATPISHELYTKIVAGEPWPDAVEPIKEADDKPVEPDIALAKELTDQQAAAKKWLTELGHKPQTQDEADKAANFADAFAKIQAKAVSLHKVEKAVPLEMGRMIDAKWFETRDSAETAKKWAKGLSDDYAKAETARRAEEARIANEKAQQEFAEAKRIADAQAAQDAALAAKGVVAPAFSPPIEAPKEIVAEPVRIGTTGRRQSLRKFDSWEIESTSILLRFLAERNMHGDDLKKAALAEGRALVNAGITVPGLKQVSVEKVA